MTAVLSVLFEVTLYSAVLYGAILLFKRLFHRHISPFLNYAVWGLLVLRLLIPVTIDSGLHLFVTPETAAQVNHAGVGDDTHKPAARQQRSGFTTGQYSGHSAADQAAVPNAPESQTNAEEVVRPSSRSVDWQTALGLLWIIGMTGSFVYTAALRLRLRRNTGRYGEIPPGHVSKLVEACKMDMGVRAHIEVSVQTWLRSPALCSSLRPKLLLPKSMLCAVDTRQLEFGIRHELTHYRRKDHIVCLLLSLLRCAYWFNPIVWLASRQIETDMETACDAGVTSRLSSGERIGYIRTMIDLSGDTGVQYILGMGAGSERKSMEKRIRGMFMKKKTKPAVRMAAAFIAAVMLLMCFTTACQPTPEKEIVINKGDGKLEEAIASSAQSQKYQVPEHWTDSANTAGFSVSIDAVVNVPDAGRFPVGVVAADEISQEQADKIMEVFLQGSTLYEQGPDLDAAMTKDQIMDRIVQIQQDISDPNSDFNTKCMEGTPEYEEGLASRQAQIASLQRKYAAAPDTMPEARPASTKYEQDLDSNILAPLAVPADATDEEREQTEAHNKDKREHAEKYLPYEITGVAALPDGRSAYLSITKSTGDYGPARAYFGAGTEVIPETLLLGRYTGIPIVPCSVSLEEAKAQALETLRKLGLDYYAVAAVQTGYFIERDPKTQEALSKHQCHILILTRELNGVISNYALNIEPQDMRYADTLSYEGAQITVGGQGVISFSWIQPMKLLNVENENVSLKPFSEVQEIFKKQITIKGAWNTTTAQDKNVVSRRIVIEEARLGLMRTVRRDRPGEYLLLPVWDFYGYEVNKCEKQIYQGPELDENNEYTVRDFGRSYLTINAIDGSVIDRGMGY